MYGESKRSGNEVNYKDCPICGDTSWHFYLNTTTGEFFCHKCGRGGCTPKGSSTDLSLLFRHIRPDYAWPEIDLPEHKPLSDVAKSYLAMRRINIETYTRLGFVEAIDEPRIIIPFFDDTSRLIYWIARSYDSTVEPKYKNMPGVPCPLYAVGYGAPVIVEGVFDAIRINYAGFYGIALGSKTLHKVLYIPLAKELLKLKYNEVTICLDGDALSDSIQLQRILKHNFGVSATIACLPFGKDPADMDLHTLNNLLSDAKGN